MIFKIIGGGEGGRRLSPPLAPPPPSFFYGPDHFTSQCLVESVARKALNDGHISATTDLLIHLILSLELDFNEVYCTRAHAQSTNPSRDWRAMNPASEPRSIEPLRILRRWLDDWAVQPTIPNY